MNMSHQSPASTTNNNQLVTRKRRRGMIEKKRRDKINSSLGELRRLVPAAFEKQGSSKLEKAEILQMTVDYLRLLHTNGLADILISKSKSLEQQAVSHSRPPPVPAIPVTSATSLAAAAAASTHSSQMALQYHHSASMAKAEYSCHQHALAANQRPSPSSSSDQFSSSQDSSTAGQVPNLQDSAAGYQQSRVIYPYQMPTSATQIYPGYPQSYYQSYS